MEPLKWDDSYSVGDEQMDKQHHKIIDLINRLNDNLAQKKDRTDVGAIIEELYDYGAYHLDCEEEMLEKSGFPGFHSHRQIHQKYREQISGYVRNFKEEKDDQVYNIIKFLQTWWLEHINGIDKMYAQFIQAKQT